MGLISLAPSFLGADPVPFELTLTVDVSVDVNFFSKRWQVSQAFVKDCGLAMGGIAALALGQPGGKMSSLVCADSFENLVIPSASDMEPFDQGIRLSAKEINPSAVDQGAAAKSIGLGVIMAFGYTLFVVLSSVACCCFYRLAHSSQQMSKGAHDIPNKAGYRSEEESDHSVLSRV